MPASEPVETPHPDAYAICNAADIVVDLSDLPGTAECPATHARNFLVWLVKEPALAGRDVLEKVLKRLYTAVFCRDFGLRPLTWLSVLHEFNTLMKLISGTETFKSYKPVYRGARRHRLRVYHIPLPQGMPQDLER
jgi:hypothetical protein